MDKDNQMIKTVHPVDAQALVDTGQGKWEVNSQGVRFVRLAEGP